MRLIRNASLGDRSRVGSGRCSVIEAAILSLDCFSWAVLRFGRSSSRWRTMPARDVGLRAAGGGDRQVDLPIDGFLRYRDRW
jgi:hypothetical protein